MPRCFFSKKWNTRSWYHMNLTRTLTSIWWNMNTYLSSLKTDVWTGNRTLLFSPQHPLVSGSLLKTTKRSWSHIKDMDIVVTEISIGSVCLAIHIHINNVFATCEPPSCSYPELWRLDESACEREENEYGCRSFIEHENNLGKFTADMLRSYNHQNVQAWTSSLKSSMEGFRLRKYTWYLITCVQCCHSQGWDTCFFFSSADPSVILGLTWVHFNDFCYAYSAA